MPADQFNVRLRDGLGHQVRVRAAELGCKPRDVIEDALVAAGFTRISIDPGQLPPPDPTPSAPAGACPECGGEWITLDGRTFCADCQRART